MNINAMSCAICHETFDYAERSPIALSGCSHRICRPCAGFSEGEFICPVDGMTSHLPRRKSFVLRSESSNNRLPAKPDEPGFPRSLHSGDDLSDLGNLEILGPREDAMRPQDTFGFHSLNKPFIPDERDKEGDIQGTSFSSHSSGPGFEPQRSHRSSQAVSSRGRTSARCELHPDHLLDIICKNPKCQKYVCLECVAFGNHSVG